MQEIAEIEDTDGGNPYPVATNAARLRRDMRKCGATEEEIRRIFSYLPHLQPKRRPNAPRPTKGKGKAFEWLAAHVNYQGKDCLQWPFSRDGRVGRGRVGYNGVQYWAHRLMCILAHSEPPTHQHQAAHECGKGHFGCVNPRHLSWKTNSENQIDRRKTGSMLRNNYGKGGALTPEQQAEIISLKGKMTQVGIAAKFGVSLGCVQYWHKWRDIRRSRKSAPADLFAHATPNQQQEDAPT